MDESVVPPNGPETQKHYCQAQSTLARSSYLTIFLYHGVLTVTSLRLGLYPSRSLDPDVSPEGRAVRPKRTVQDFLGFGSSNVACVQR